MLVKEQKQLQNMVKKASLFALLVLAFALVAPAYAQYGQVPGAPSEQSLGKALGNTMGGPDNWIGPMQPPPIGDGPMAPPVDPGDLGPALPPPSGTADSTSGSIFPTTVGTNRTKVYIYVNGRMVQTIRPDQLTNQQIQAIDGILGINMLSGQQTIQVQASDNQIAQIQNVMFPWPQGWQTMNGKKKIVSDKPALGYPKPGENSLWDFYGPLPTVRVFGRYLVILGMVVATMFVATNAVSLMLGHPNAPEKIAQTFIGLATLCCGFTIWKVVQLNVINGMPNNLPFANDRMQVAPVAQNYLLTPDLPATPPNVNSGPPRAGIPVEPLGAPQYP